MSKYFQIGNLGVENYTDSDERDINEPLSALDTAFQLIEADVAAVVVSSTNWALVSKDWAIKATDITPGYGSAKTYADQARADKDLVVDMKNTTLAARNTAILAQTAAEAAEDGAVAAQAASEAARDITTAARDTTLAARDTTLGYRNEAELFAAQAQSAATGAVPIGTIVALYPGWWTLPSEGYSSGLGPTTAAIINNYIGPNWKLCDGSSFYDEESVFFNAAGRQLPQLTGNRFLKGCAPGSEGVMSGSNTISIPTHTHPFNHGHSQFTSAGTSITVAQLPSYTLAGSSMYEGVGPSVSSLAEVQPAASPSSGFRKSPVQVSSGGSGQAHTHAITVPAAVFTTSIGGNTTLGSVPYNLSVLFIIRVR
jgi:hypothetical protein